MLDESDKKIIEQIREGKTYEEMTKIIFMASDTIKRRVRIMKGKFNCKTLAELIYKMSKTENIKL